MKFDNIIDVLIIGAGASGMTAAIAAGRAGASVLVSDGNEKAGKKVFATGNGRCNFTNLNCSPEGFNRPEDGFTGAVLDQFSAEDAIAFFRELGMMSRTEQEGRCYPYSGQAAAVVSFLEQEMKRVGAQCLLGDRAVSSERVRVNEAGGADGAEAPGSGAEEAYFVTTLASGRTIRSRTLVVACGGKAGPHFGSSGDGYGLARSFGHSLEPPRPALVGCVSGDPLIRSLRGRARAAVTLYENGRQIAREQGEVQFTGMGISGICVMDLTRFMDAPRPVKKKKEPVHNPGEKQYEIRVDFVPELTAEELAEFLGGSLARGESREEALSGVLNSRTAQAFAEQCAGIEDAVRMIKGLRVPVESTLGWKDAQVSRGGVRREEIHADTLASRLVPGLYFCGEVLDVDGRCGGYNLQWAWASGFVSGKNAAAMAAGSPSES